MWCEPTTSGKIPRPSIISSAFFPNSQGCSVKCVQFPPGAVQRCESKGNVPWQPTWEAEIDTKRSVSLRERIYGCFTVTIWNVPSIYEFTFLNNGIEGFVPYSPSARAA